MTYTWQSITKNIHVEDIGLKVDRRLDKIKKHVLHFPQDSVHLNISLEKNTKKELYTAGLTLHLPSNILHAEKSSANLMTAFDNAADALVREIKALKSDLRGAEQWERKDRRALLHESKPLRFAALPSKEETPQDVPEVLPELWLSHLTRLLYHVKQTIRRDEDAGRIPRGQIDPDAVVAEVERQVLAAPHKKPKNQSYKLWFYVMANEELERRIAEVRQKARFARARAELVAEAEVASYPPSAPREVRRRKFEPPPVHLVEIAEFESVPEDPERLEQAWEELLQAAEEWPEEERGVFELHFLEGFQPAEIGVLMRLETEQARHIHEMLQDRVRDAIRHATKAELALSQT